jgi:hypothetical protein
MQFINALLWPTTRKPISNAKVYGTNELILLKFNDHKIQYTMNAMLLLSILKQKISAIPFLTVGFKYVLYSVQRFANCCNWFYVFEAFSSNLQS